MPVPRSLSRLLSLYPSRFRDRYEREMGQLLEHDYERENARGRHRRAWFVLRTGLDLLANAAMAWAQLAFRLARSNVLDWRSIRRSLVKTPGFPILVVVIVAMSVTVTATVAGFYRGTLFRPTLFEDPDRVVLAWGSNVASGQLRDVIAGPNFLDLRAATASLEELAALHASSAVILRGGRPKVIGVLETTVDFLDVLGVVPALGGNFSDEHRRSSGPDAVLLSHRFWQDQLNAAPDVVGTALVLDGRPHTVVGVLDAGFEFLLPFPLIRPLREDLLLEDDRTYHHYWMVGRLAAGATPAEASRELSARFARIAKEDDPRLLGWSVLVEPIGRVSLEAVRPLLFAIGAAVVLVIIAAGLNLATLNLVRTFGRSRELFIRSLLGANRIELAGIVVRETGLLCLTGAGLGLVAASALIDRAASFIPTFVPIPGSAAYVNVVHASNDIWVLLCGGSSAALMWALVSAPAVLRLPGPLSPSRDTSASAGSRTTSSHRRTRNLVIAELALATLLLVVAGLFERTATRLLSVDPGVDPDGLLTMYVGQLKDPSSEVRARFFRDVVREVERIPGVLRAGVSDYVPFQGEDDFMGFRLADRPPPPPGEGLREEWRRVSDGFFETAGLSILGGRGFEARDYESGTKPRVAVVNAAFAARYWPGRDAVGQRVEVARAEYGDIEVIGVVEDVPARGPALPPPPMFFVPHHGWPRDNMGLFVRVEGRPVDFIDAVREAVWRVDPSQPIERVHTMEALVANAVALPRLAGRIVSLFACLALSLSILGLFGVTGYSVRTRRAELGIRLALGATPRRLKRDLLLEGAPLAVAGIGVGAIIGIGAGYVGRSLLHGVTPHDPMTLALSALLVAVSALAATAIPARRVVRIDPARSIRD